MIAPSSAVPADRVMSSAGRADNLDELSFVRKQIDSDGSSSDGDVDQVSFPYKPHNIPYYIGFRAAGHFCDRTVGYDAIMVFFDYRVIDPALGQSVDHERTPDDNTDLYGHESECDQTQDQFRKTVIEMI